MHTRGAEELTKRNIQNERGKGRINEIPQSVHRGKKKMRRVKKEPGQKSETSEGGGGNWGKGNWEGATNSTGSPKKEKKIGATKRQKCRIRAGKGGEKWQKVCLYPGDVRRRAAQPGEDKKPEGLVKK